MKRLLACDITDVYSARADSLGLEKIRSLGLYAMGGIQSTIIASCSFILISTYLLYLEGSRHDFVHRLITERKIQHNSLL